MNDPRPPGAARIPEHIAVYRRLREAFGDPSVRGRDARRRREAARHARSEPFGSGRDPIPVAAAFGSLASSRGWEEQLARAELVTAWPELVGPDTAAHSRPERLDDGVLVVRCDSTAWAQQLRLMRSGIADRIAARFPAAQVERIDFLGPDAPSWKHGPRATRGRGPRDTYG